MPCFVDVDRRSVGGRCEKISLVTFGLREHRFEQRSGWQLRPPPDSRQKVATVVAAACAMLAESCAIRSCFSLSQHAPAHPCDANERLKSQTRRRERRKK